MSTPQIVTSHDFPPIPIRTMDWSAHYDGYEESGPYGHGRTEQDAINDLIDNYEAPERGEGYWPCHTER